MRDQDAEHQSLWSVNFHIGDATSDSCLTHLARLNADDWEKLKAEIAARKLRIVAWICARIDPSAVFVCKVTLTEHKVPLFG